MPKINLKTLLKSNHETIEKKMSGLYANNKIIYNDDGINVTIEFDNNKLILKRENNDYELILDFTLNKSSYLLKEYNKMINFDIVTKKIINEEKYLYINYDLLNGDDVDSYEFIVEYEVI